MAGLTDGQLIGLITLGLGVVAFFAILEWRRRSLRLYRGGVTVEAEVLSSERRTGEHGGVWYRTGIRYRDISGDEVSRKLNLSRSYSRHDKINIVYDPNKTSRVLTPESELGSWNPDGGLLAFGKRWGLVLIFVIPGLLMILFPFGDPICDDPTFHDMNFCVAART